MRPLIALLMVSTACMAETDYAGLIARLGDESYEKRDAAQAELEALGTEALPAAEAALDDPALEDAEIRMRLREVVATLKWAKALRDDPASLAREACKDGEVLLLESEKLRAVFGTTRVFRVTTTAEGARTLLVGAMPGQRVFLNNTFSNLMDVAPLLRPMKSVEEARAALATLADLGIDPTGSGGCVGSTVTPSGEVGGGAFNLFWVASHSSLEISIDEAGRIVSAIEQEGC
jgi:hypothetical protein